MWAVSHVVEPLTPLKKTGSMAVALSFVLLNTQNKGIISYFSGSVMTKIHFVNFKDSVNTRQACNSSQCSAMFFFFFLSAWLDNTSLSELN